MRLWVFLEVRHRFRSVRRHCTLDFNDRAWPSYADSFVEGTQTFSPLTKEMMQSTIDNLSGKVVKSCHGGFKFLIEDRKEGLSCAASAHWMLLERYEITALDHVSAIRVMGDANAKNTPDSHMKRIIFRLPTACRC